MMTFFRIFSSLVLLFLDFEEWVNKNNKKGIFVCTFLGSVACFFGVVILGGTSISIPFFDALKRLFGLILLIFGAIVATMPYRNTKE